MTKEEFIKKWNVAFEDKEQDAEFAAEMEADLKAVISAVEENIVLKITVENGNCVNLQSSLNNLEVIGHLDMIKMAMRNKIINEYKPQS